MFYLPNKVFLFRQPSTLGEPVEIYEVRDGREKQSPLQGPRSGLCGLCAEREGAEAAKDVGSYRDARDGFEISGGNDECDYIGGRECAHNAEHLLRNAVPDC
jgi:hypothetical protein